jgi:hypothetical protein
VDIDELDRNDVAGCMAVYDANRERLLKMPTWKRASAIEPLLMLHDDPAVMSRAIKAKYPND